MVGVAGGSKGCQTCRKRKIKCDLQTPVCCQCIRSRRQCSGPNLQKRGERWSVVPSAQGTSTSGLAPVGQDSRSYKTVERKFIIMLGTVDQLKIDRSDECPTLTLKAHTPSPSATLECTGSSVLSSPSSSSSSSSSRSIGTPVVKRRSIFDKLAFQEITTISGHVGYSPTQAIVDSKPSLVLTNLAVDDACFQILLSSFMNNFCAMTSTHFDGCSFDPWIAFMPNFVYSTTPALAYASRAVVVGHFSRVRPNRDLQLYGARLYVQALRYQNRQISESIRQLSVNDDIITAGLFLGLYEAFYCTSLDTWRELMKGCLRLFELRGPHAFKSGISAVIYQSARTILTIYVLLAGMTPCFLTEPDWLTIPFETMPQKQPHQTLNDILLCLPQYQNIILTLRPESQWRRKLSLEQRMATAAAFFGLVELRTKLDKWLIDYKRLVSGIESDDLPDSVLYRANYNKKCDLNATNEQWSTTHIFKPPLVFANSSVANLVPLYYAALGIIRRSQCAAYDCAQEFPGAQNDLVTMPFEEFERLSCLLVARYNRLICQSVDYMIGSHPAIGAANIVFPLKIAQVFLKDPLEKYWAFKLCEKVDKLFGLAISMIRIEEEDNMVIAQMVDLLPACSHCGEKLRPNVQTAST